MSWLKRLKALVRYAPLGQWYSVRRAALWPEHEYKRGMLRRVQGVYQLPYFVETGTHLGETPLALRDQFERLWTIEMDPVLFENAKQKLSSYDNIKCLRGDSRELLAGVVGELDKGTLFWLDGHYSGVGTAEGGNPIIEELRLISRSTAKDRHAILIDDISEFCGPQRSARLQSVLDLLEEINPKFTIYFDYDMLFALPYERQHRGFWKEIVYPFVVR